MCVQKMQSIGGVNAVGARNSKILYVQLLYRDQLESKVETRKEKHVP